MEELQQLGVALVSLTDAAYALRASHSTLKTSSESGPSRQSSGQPGLFGERRRVVLLELRQRPPEVWEIVGVQNLDASGVVAIERCGASGAPGVRPIDGRVKPQSEVVGVDRFRDGVEVCVQDAVRGRCWHRAGSDDERLDVEASDEFRVASPFVVGLDIPLIPG